jgi:hypothetical protein
MTGPLPPAVIGQSYRVEFTLAGKRKPRVLRGRYLGWSKFYTRHEFDLRPDAGTTGIFPGQIVSIKQEDGPPILPED